MVLFAKRVWFCIKRTFSPSSGRWWGMSSVKSSLRRYWVLGVLIDHYQRRVEMGKEEGILWFDGIELFKTKG